MKVLVLENRIEMLNLGLAEKVMIQELDFYTLIHRASGDCQNEVERTQSAVGKAISEGGSINWEYKSLDIHSEHSEHVHNMNLEQLEVYEDEIYMHNVTETCKELAMRIENSPGPLGWLYGWTGS